MRAKRTPTSYIPRPTAAFRRWISFVNRSRTTPAVAESRARGFARSSARGFLARCTECRKLELVLLAMKVPSHEIVEALRGVTAQIQRLDACSVRPDPVPSGTRAQRPRDLAYGSR